METIAVFFGGRSAEHDISIVTALASIIKPLELTHKYRLEAVYIAKNGTWYWDERLKDIELYRSGAVEQFIQKMQPAGVQFTDRMTLIKPAGFVGRNVAQKIDVAFPAMHGTYGEDGALMGLFDMANIPYVGCGLSASVLAMDKILAKQIASAHGIMTSKFIALSSNDVNSNIDAVVATIESNLSMPVFIKPARLGSSIGITRANDKTALRNGLEVAAHYDNRIIVEEAVHNLIEVTLPIIGNDIPQPSLLERPLTQAEDFFDFDTKYLRRGKKGKANGKGSKGAQGYSQIPADLPKELYAKAEAIGLAVYYALGCSGIARVDMLIDSKTGDVFFNEINPLPGGLYAHNWNKTGISNVQLVEKLIGFAKERHSTRNKLATAFSTNFLKQF